MTMQSVRVKICGITNVEDAVAASNAGADAIGMVFYKKSPRYIDLETAVAIAESVPPFVNRVGLFVNADAKTILRTLDRVSLDYIQFHGNESPADCGKYDIAYIKAINVKPDMDYRTFEENYSQAAALLLDTHVAGTPGGTGQPFDWGLVPEKRNKHLILAGGLNSDNVSLAINTVKPFAVDVCSGVEVSKGKKAADRIELFINAVRQAHPGN